MVPIEHTCKDLPCVEPAAWPALVLFTTFSRDHLTKSGCTLGQKAIRNMLPMQQGDVPRTFASPDLLRALTGYVPDVKIEAGVAAFVEWYRDWRSGKA